MRLTLRTLLAYLDEQLPADEAEVLHRRIEESEFASTLVQRIRHIVKRQRLTAPKVEGRGLGSDPNSVAEYLDSTLAHDRVTEFERVCLESDIHLAEVAACHQILCKVLSEPAQISPELRSKLHSLPEKISSGHFVSPVEHHRVAEPMLPEEPQESRSGLVMQPMAAPHVVAVAVPLDQPPVERPRPEVPDYLKPEPAESRSQLLTVLGLIAIAAVVLLIISPVGQSYLKKFIGQTELAQVNEDQPANPASTENSSQDKTDSGDQMPPEKMDNAADDKNAPPDDSADSGKKLVDVLNPPEQRNGEKLVPPGDRAASDDSAKKTDDDAKMAVRPEGNPVVPPPVPLPPAEEGSTAKTPENPVPEVAPAKEASPLGEVGRFISDEMVLARFSNSTSNWVRIPPRALIAGGERLVTLPVYRPQISLATGVQITAAGEGSFAFDRGTATPIAMLVEQGKFLLVTAGVPQANLEMNLNGLAGVLRLPNSDAQAAVEVYGYMPPGRDPQTSEPIPVAYIYSLSGTITWERKDAEPVSIEPNQVQILVGDEEPRLQGPVKLPAWVDARNTATLDRDAAKMTEQLVNVDRPLSLSLSEIAEHRRIDVRVHVARCLAQLNEYETILRHLSLEEYRPYASTLTETLRLRMAHGKEIAAMLQLQLEQLRGAKDSATLYRLLCGYDESQLVAQGGAEELVGLLESSHPDIRWLAYDNLRRITGTGIPYNAALPPEKNRSALVRFSKMLKDGEIAYASRPTPLIPLQPLTPASEKTEK